MSKQSRDFIAALQISLDGNIQGANGEIDWVDSWNDALDLISDVDAAVLGGGMYPGYEQLWGSIAADPHSAATMLGREATDGEVEYARWTQRTPHYVLSTTLEQGRLGDQPASCVRSANSGPLRNNRVAPSTSSEARRSYRA